MPERPERILKIVCLALGALLVFQLVQAFRRANPLAEVTIPELPALPNDTPAEEEVTNANPAVASGTLTNAERTNSVPSSAVSDTNHPAAEVKEAIPSNAAPAETSRLGSTNSAPAQEVAKPGETNVAPVLVSATAPTNVVTSGTGTNSHAGTAAQTGTNHPVHSLLAAAGGQHLPTVVVPGMPAGPGRVSGLKQSKLPPDVEARVDRITQSEILGPVIHPMPMALLGIAGNVAFLRAPSGQTGLVKEGDDLGDVKLLKIGTNRVLVEEKGEKKELTIFSGLGGESLLPKPETPK